MDRVALVARLNPGTEERAAELIERGPPFDPGERGFERHTVYLSAGEVVFVFEGEEVEWALDELVSGVSERDLPPALEGWRDLVEGPPRIARAAYVWDRPG
jgi:hypothetical protein